MKLDDGEKRAYLLKQLGGLASLSSNLQSGTAAGTPSKRVQAASSVESACERALSAFAITDRNFDLEVALGMSPMARILAFQIAGIVRPDRHFHSPLDDEESRGRITTILEGIVILRDAARRARQQAEQEMGTGLGGARRSEDLPLKQMAWYLLRLYIELTGRAPGVSNPPGGSQRGGPTVQFLDFCLRWLGWRIKPNTAALLIEELRNDAELLAALNNPIFKSKDF